MTVKIAIGISLSMLLSVWLHLKTLWKENIILAVLAYRLVSLKKENQSLFFRRFMEEREYFTRILFVLR